MIALCDFRQVSPSQRRCEGCGYAYHATADAPPRRRKCGSPSPAAEVEAGPCGGCVTGMPGALRRAWSFAKAVAFWAARGARRPTEEQYRERQAICGACPYLVQETKCGVCGCYVSLKAAIVSAEPGQSDCPKGRWPSL